MKKTIGYQITEPDIDKTLNYLRTTIDKDATREDAIEYLQEHQSMAHVVAHKIVEDEKKITNNPNKNKQYELKNIDDFIKRFDEIKNEKGELKRISDENQEIPDAILELNGRKIALEATLAFPPGYKPHENPPSEAAYNPHPAIDEIFRLIEDKSLADYSGLGVQEVWLLIDGGAYISNHDLKDRLKELELNNFDRVFIHKGTGNKIIEIYKL